MADCATERRVMAELRALKVMLAALLARVTVWTTEGVDVDDEVWRSVASDVSACLTSIRRADVTACRLSQPAS